MIAEDAQTQRNAEQANRQPQRQQELVANGAPPMMWLWFDR
jgi:hypothetical protein